MWPQVCELLDPLVDAWLSDLTTRFHPNLEEAWRREEWLSLDGDAGDCEHAAVVQVVVPIRLHRSPP